MDVALCHNCPCQYNDYEGFVDEAGQCQADAGVKTVHVQGLGTVARHCPVERIVFRDGRTFTPATAPDLEVEK